MDWGSWRQSAPTQGGRNGSAAHVGCSIWEPWLAAEGELWGRAVFNPCCLWSQCRGGPHWHFHCPGPAAAADEAGEGGGHVWCCLCLADEPLPDDPDAGKTSAPSSPSPNTPWPAPAPPGWSPARRCVTVPLKAAAQLEWTLLSCGVSSSFMPCQTRGSNTRSLRALPGGSAAPRSPCEQDQALCRQSLTHTTSLACSAPQPSQYFQYLGLEQSITTAPQDRQTYPLEGSRGSEAEVARAFWGINVGVWGHHCRTRSAP